MPFTIFPSTYQTQWWGSLAGDMANQRDLTQALDAKADIAHVHADNISEFPMIVSFSKYGPIAADEFIMPHVIYIEGFRAQIKMFRCQTSVGTLSFSLKQNARLLAEIDEIEVTASLQSQELLLPVELSDGDVLSLEINEANASAKDIYMELVVIYKKINSN